MNTLLLKTEGMSSYGLQTFDVHRKVNHFPTRSAVMGMLAASMGIRRDQQPQLFELSQQVKIAVQVNKAGEKVVDYHTVQQFRSPAGKIQSGTKPTYREYWCDSEHSFAISAEGAVIEHLARTVKSPAFNVFQGRKCCPLTRPLFEGVSAEGNPVTALGVLGGSGQIFSDVSGGGEIATTQVRDLTTAQHRKYAMRTVYVYSDPSRGIEEVGGESINR